MWGWGSSPPREVEIGGPCPEVAIGAPTEQGICASLGGGHGRALPSESPSCPSLARGAPASQGSRAPHGTGQGKQNPIQPVTASPGHRERGQHVCPGAEPAQGSAPTL